MKSLNHLELLISISFVSSFSRHTKIVCICYIFCRMLFFATCLITFLDTGGVTGNKLLPTIICVKKFCLFFLKERVEKIVSNYKPNLIS